MGDKDVLRNGSPYVSVIIPTYNRADCVTNAIDSVLAQTYADYEIIVIDDGSEDNTQEVISAYGDRLTHIHQDNQGLAAARNAGVRAARGEWIALLDSDDVWLPEKLAVQIGDLAKHFGLCLHTTNATVFREHIGQEVNYFDFAGISKLLEGEFSVFESPLSYQMEYGLVWAQCVLVKRQTLIDSGLYDTRLTIYTDLDMFCRVALYGSFGVNSRELAHIQRRDEQKPNISQQRISDPVHSWKTLVYIYDKLTRDAKVSADEKQLVRNKLASCRAALGMEMLKAGRKLSARNILRQTLTNRASLKSLIRYMISFLPAYASKWIVRYWHSFRYGKSLSATMRIRRKAP
jgi:glycosyltransferase involved in cell wall biosynthesis